MRKVKYYKCPECQKKFKTMTGWAEHMNTMHPNVRPEGFSDSRFFYYILTGMTAGKCIECKSPTEWNEATAKYNRFCNNPNCKKSYVKLAKSRMISKYGKEYLLNDPDMQRKMLLSKKISGYYNFSNGSGKLGYVGTYEKDFLQMMDQFMGYSASDIMSPSPHTYFYDYDGKQHFYIPDFYIPNLNLEIEIKAQDNTHPKILAIDKVKEKLKDDVMSSNPKINYLKINDKDYTSFFDYLLNLKESIDETAISNNGSISSEINQVLESAYECEEESEEGFDYDPHLCAIREGVFEKFNCGDMRNSDLKLCIFTFFTTTSGTRHTGFASGYDGFSNIAFQSLTGAYDCASPVYLFTPEYEGDFASRTPGMYIREFKSYNDIHPFSPDNVSNEYMTFMVALRRDGWDRNQFDVNIIRRLRDKIYNDKPLLCDWDKISDDCVNNQNKYHYLCYGILNELLGERYRLYNDSDLFESEVIMIDRGLMCEFDWNRILDIINSYKDEIFEKPAYFYNIAREESESYDELEPAIEKLLYENTFSDIEPATEGTFKTEENIEKNVNIWAPGKHNILFVVGVGGSGKTTLSRKYGADKNAIVVHLDELNRRGAGSESNPAIRNIINEIRKRCPDYDYFFRNPNTPPEYLNTMATKDIAVSKALDTLIRMCHEDSENIYILEGLHIYQYLNPQYIKDEPHIIVGTSAVKSWLRTMERTVDKNPGIDGKRLAQLLLTEIVSLPRWARQDASIQRFKNDMSKEATFIDEPATENIQLHTNFDKVKVKGTLDLTKYRKITLSQEVLDKYKEKCASFGHCRISNMSRGYVWVDKSDNIVGFVNVVRKQDNIKWIQALNLQPNYQGYGLYEQLLKVAVRELGGTDIETPPKNDTAKEVYNKFGFKVYTDEQSRRCMSIRADAARNKYGDKAKTNATSMTEAGLFPVYVILTNASKLEGDYAKLLTKSNYAHVSLAFNASMQEVYSFGTKDGHTMLPISTEAKNLMYKLKTDPEANYAIYTKLVSKKDFESISGKVKSMYAQKGGFNYDMPQAVKDKMNSDSVNEKKYFCSSFVAYLMGVSRNVSEIPDIKNIYLVDMGLVKDYKQAFIEKKTNAVYEKHYMQKEKNSDKQPIDEESNK